MVDVKKAVSKYWKSYKKGKAEKKVRVDEARQVARERRAEMVESAKEARFERKLERIRKQPEILAERRKKAKDFAKKTAGKIGKSIVEGAKKSARGAGRGGYDPFSGGGMSFGNGAGLGGGDHLDISNPFAQKKRSKKGKKKRSDDFGFGMLRL